MPLIKRCWLPHRLACFNSLKALCLLIIQSVWQIIFSMEPSSSRTSYFSWVPFGLFWKFSFQFLQLLSPVWLFVNPWVAAGQASLPITSSPRACSKSCPPSQWCHPTNSSSAIPFSSYIFSSIRVVSNELALHIRWPKYWSFSVSTNPYNWYSGLIFLGLTGMISLSSKGLSRVFSNTTVQKHQVFSAQLYL